MAFLTEDRKETGCFLILDVLENMQIAVLQHGYVNGGLRRAEREIEAHCEEHERNAARQDAGPARSAIDEPVGRQSAEGADRALAADQAARS